MLNAATTMISVRSEHHVALHLHDLEEAAVGELSVDDGERLAAARGGSPRPRPCIRRADDLHLVDHAAALEEDARPPQQEHEGSS
jgi:hypothetical protein